MNDNSLKTTIVRALESKYQGEMEVARANIEIYMQNAVGIGEHSRVLDAVDEQIAALAHAAEKLYALKNNL